MAERPEDSRFPRPIVPDPDASLSGHRHPAPSPARLWPLWLLILLLVLALAALAAAGWMERQRFEQRLAQLGGEVSNVHARFDTQAGRGEALEAIQQRLASLQGLEERLDERRESRLAAWEEERLAPLAEALSDLEARLATLEEDGEVRGTTLEAVRTSLDALERAGQEGRAALRERLATVAEGRDASRSRLASLEADRQATRARLAGLQARLEEHADAAATRLSALEERTTALADEVEALTGAGDDAQGRVASLEARLADMQTELRELRQSQLALNAQLEALRE
ncbi:hypothetical protein [Halomonas nitroreducens]|uniref:Chromosome partition protein Smc n=1 Tax=Halomonas nitroreducens TaxID=447425 RepID=A0A3S0JXA1_9GAMM|nr:hypothetical protein [Halomonas nitroreducens]RTR05086.1 hypothetical protein EKG36_08190 [Halomonas nitroreducens]